MTSGESDLPKKKTDDSDTQPGNRLYTDAAGDFAGSFVRAVAAPLRGFGQVAGTAPAETAPADESTAGRLGTMAGTAFDFVVGNMVLGRVLPGVSALTRASALNTGLGFLEPTRDGSLNSHLQGAVVGFGTGLAMGGVETAWRANGAVSRLASGTASSLAGGVTNIELASKFQTGEFAGLSQVAEAGFTWGGVALILGGAREGGGAAFRSLMKSGAPAAELPKVVVETPPVGERKAPVGQVEAASQSTRLKVDKPALEPAEPVSQQAVPSVQPQTVIDRIRQLAQQQPWYGRVQDGDTYLKCLLFSKDLSAALDRAKIKHIMVATTDGTANHMPMHNFILAKTESGQIVHVDPTVSQFVPNYKDVFIGSRAELLNVARSSHGDIKVWEKITENRSNWNKVWAEEPLLYPKRFVEPTPEARADFQKEWGAANVQMYRDHLAGVLEQAKTLPSWREHALKAFPTEFVRRLDAAVSEWKASSNPQRVAAAGSERGPVLPPLEIA